MSHHDERRQHIRIPDASKNPNRRTTRARGLLYDLITRFRKDAREADTAATRAIFGFAAETLSGLVRAFRTHEQTEKSTPEANQHDEQDST